MSYDSRAIGNTIRKLRKSKGLSQEVLSGLAVIARSHLAEIENGNKNANINTLWRIAEALDMRLSEMIRMAEDEEEKLK